MSKKNDIENLIHLNKRRLQKLKERKAREGGKVSPDVLMDIEDIIKENEMLTKELKELENEAIEKETPVEIATPQQGFKMVKQNLGKQHRIIKPIGTLISGVVTSLIANIIVLKFSLTLPFIFAIILLWVAISGLVDWYEYKEKSSMGIAVVTALLAMVLFIFSFYQQTMPFTYLVRVVAKDNNQALPNAHVIIEIEGKSPLDEYTDSLGGARIFIDSSYIEQPGVLRVNAKGYSPYEQNITLKQSALPDKILLEANP